MTLLLIDTNILLDVALDQAPHAATSARLLDLLEKRPGIGWMAWHSISNFYYIVRPKRGRDTTRAMLKELAKFIDVAPTITSSLKTACDLPMTDFEDAMQVAAALSCSAQHIVTRNLRDYRQSPIRAIDPQAALDLLAQQGLEA